MLRLLRRRACRWDFPLLCLPYFGYTAFAWSATLVDVSLTTVIVESWPLFYVPLAERLLRQQGRYLRPTLFRMVLVLLAFGGFVMVVSSHTGGLAAWVPWTALPSWVWDSPCSGPSPQRPAPTRYAGLGTCVLSFAPCC